MIENGYDTNRRENEFGPIKGQVKRKNTSPSQK
jgi:hypothetical protein